jgi:hypothetical protein
MEGCKPGALTVANILGDRVLVDGHHTYDICQALGLPLCEPLVISLPNRDEARRWMRQNQLARRNLTDERRTYYLGDEFNARKQPHGGQKAGIRQNDGSVASTAEAIAAEHGVSASTVERAGKFADAVNAIGEQNPAAKDAILAGATEVTKAEVVGAAHPGKLYCDACVADGPKRGCRQCKRKRYRSAVQKKAAAKKKADTLLDRLIPDLRQLVHENRITPKLLASIAALDRNQQGVVVERVRAGINPRKAIAEALAPAREPGVEEPTSRKPKPGKVLFDWRAFDEHLRRVLQLPESVAKAFPGEETSPDFEKARRTLNDLAKIVKDWRERLTK